MRDRCANYWEQIVNLAEGKQEQAAREHVDSCPECARKLEQLQAAMRVGDMRFYDAPASLIANVKGLMPAPERKVVSLLRSTTAWSGARAVADDFQIVVGDEDTQVRLMYSRSGSNWEVMGRAPSSNWTAAAGGQELVVEEDGRFSFVAAKLSDTDLILSSPDGELFIPSAEELLSSGPDQQD
jgi:hypothetical protein